MIDNRIVYAYCFGANSFINGISTRIRNKVAVLLGDWCVQRGLPRRVRSRTLRMLFTSQGNVTSKAKLKKHTTATSHKMAGTAVTERFFRTHVVKLTGGTYPCP